MERTLIVATLLALGGCVTTPEDVIERGYVSTHESQSPPLRVARCIAANAEREGATIATQRALDEKGGIEVITRYPGAASVITLAQIEPSGSGSRTTMRVSPLAGAHHTVWRDELMKGC